MKRILYISLTIILAGPASQAQERKEEVFMPINFTAYEKNERLFIDWQSDSTTAMATNYFEVQRSIGGKEFRTIGLIMGPDPKQEGEHYRFVEKVKGKSNEKMYYRLCKVDNNGQKTLTKIIQPTK